MTITIEFRSNGLHARIWSPAGRIIWRRTSPYSKEKAFWRDVFKKQRECMARLK